MEKILEGKYIAAKIIDNIKKLDKPKTLGVIKVGSDKGAESYLKGIRNTADKAGIKVKVFEFNINTDIGEIKESIDSIKKGGAVDGILVLEPLPEGIKVEDVIECAGPELDVEGIHPCNMGRLILGNPLIIPSTPNAILEILSFYGIEVTGKHIVIVGRSKVVGKPLSLLLLRKEKMGNATITVCHSRTEDIRSITRNADILIVSIGRAEYITHEFVKDDSIIIDVGINMKEGRLTGDVDFDNVKDKVRAITPVPGGVGSITTASLLSNLYKLPGQTG